MLHQTLIILLTKAAFLNALTCYDCFRCKPDEAYLGEKTWNCKGSCQTTEIYSPYEGNQKRHKKNRSQAQSEVLEQLSRPKFFRDLKFPPFSTLLCAREEKGRNIKSRKKIVFLLFTLASIKSRALARGFVRRCEIVRGKRPLCRRFLIYEIYFPFQV